MPLKTKKKIRIHWKLLLIHSIAALLLLTAGRSFNTTLHSKTIDFLMTHTDEQIEAYIISCGGFGPLFTFQYYSFLGTFLAALLLSLVFGCIITIRRRLFFMHAVVPVAVAVLVNKYLFSDLIYRILFAPGRLISNDLFTASLLNSLVLLSLALFLYFNSRLVQVGLLVEKRADQ